MTIVISWSDRKDSSQRFEIYPLPNCWISYTFLDTNDAVSRNTKRLIEWKHRLEKMAGDLDELDFFHKMEQIYMFYSWTRNFSNSTQRAQKHLWKKNERKTPLSLLSVVSRAAQARHLVFFQLLQIAFCLGPSVHTFFLVSHSKYPGNIFSDNLCYVV